MAQNGDMEERVIDAIATMLGTSPEWSSEYLEDIANLIGVVRPHPGDKTPAQYRQEFREATGREVPAAFDMDEGDES